MAKRKKRSDVLYRGAWYWRKRDRSWRNSNTGETSNLPRTATLKQLEKDSVRGSAKIEPERGHVFGKDSPRAKAIAKKNREEALRVRANRRKRLQRSSASIKKKR